MSRQIGFLPPLSPYDQVRRRWTRLVLVASFVPLAYLYSRLNKSSEPDKGPLRTLNSLTIGDRYRTQLAVAQVRRNNGVSMPLTVRVGGTNINLEISLDDLCEKGYNKAVRDSIEAADAKPAAAAAQLTDAAQ